MKIEPCERWFAAQRHDLGVAQYWEPFVDPLFRSNFFHVPGKTHDLLIDSGMGICCLRTCVPDLDDERIVAIATHSHIDHIGGMHEYETRMVHPLEAEVLATGTKPMSLRTADWPAKVIERIVAGGYAVGDEMLTAYPHADFDPTRVFTRAAPATRLIEEGDVVDLGDRAFEVVHLPGHSPGSIGLFESATGILFSGDAIYDGPLLDDLPGSNTEDYVRTMERLLAMPLSVVHAGHEESFGKSRLVELAEGYLRSRAE